MAKLYITEYSQVGNSRFFPVPVPVENNVVEQTPVAIAGASAQSAAFASTTSIIRVHTDAICSIAIGSNPTATANSRRMAADTTEYFGVTPLHKIAVISNT